MKTYTTKLPSEFRAPCDNQQQNEWFDNCLIHIYKGQLGWGWTRRSNESFEVHGDVGFATKAEALAAARS